MKKRIAGFIMSFCIALCAQAAVSAANIEIGDYVQMGTYYNEPILWRCVAFEKINGYDKNGNPIIDSTDSVIAQIKGYLPLMLSDKAICIRAFDAKTGANREVGSHSRDNETGSREKYGSSCWVDSNIRVWLNSDANAGSVVWTCGNPPDEAHLWNGYNEYDKEAGFLKNFSARELNAICEVTQKIILSKAEIDIGMVEEGSEYFIPVNSIEDVVQNYTKAYANYATDKMFLLDVMQLYSVYSAGGILGNEYYKGQLTDTAVNNSEYQYDNYFFWLRTPSASTYSNMRGVFTKTGNVNMNAPYGPGAVRPAFYLDDGAEFVSGAGTEENPYIIDDFPETSFTTESSADSAMVTNVSGRTRTVTIIVADYTDGALTDIHTQTETFSAGESKQFTYGQGTEHKILVWDSIDGMRPLAK